MFIRRAGIQVEPLTIEQAHRPPGISRFRQRQTSSWPDFGDCFAYALAKLTGEPLLFKGEDLKARSSLTVASGRTARFHHLSNFSPQKKGSTDLSAKFTCQFVRSRFKRYGEFAMRWYLFL